MADLGDRTKYLGASEVAAAIGLSRYRTPWDVWAEKVGVVQPHEAGEAARIGIALEPAILSLAEQEFGPLSHDNLALAIPNTPILAHCDARLQSTGEPVEAKTAGLLGGRDQEWSNESVPMEYIVQVTVQAVAAGAEKGFIAGLVAGRGLVFSRIVVDKQFADEIIKQALDFWRYVESKKEPPSSPSLSVASRIVKHESTLVIAENDPALDVFREYLRLREESHLIQKKLDDAKAQVLLAMRDNRKAILPDGKVFYVRNQTRETVDSKRLLKEHPDMYRQYLRETRFDVLTVTESKRNANDRSLR